MFRRDGDCAGLVGRVRSSRRGWSGWERQQDNAGRSHWEQPSPQPHRRSKRFRFWPAASNSASSLTFSSPRRRKRRSPCNCFASAKRGSTPTCRLCIAMAYGSVTWSPRPRAKHSSSRLRPMRRPRVDVVPCDRSAQAAQAVVGAAEMVAGLCRTGR